ncbi:GTP-dependent dephospho-CoA kinase family protein [Halopenitus sp. POP-27]|uniref:GTP-dependent dephospho-CoA kinase family protein n=1 Tax=Halopenitus sp. POP-27 TaxID=2994425 RepID=UPI00246913FC|nr:GTP-dependent dephospho-CoA kinase family protein [Halopenitus sp. POP-27]
MLTLPADLRSEFKEPMGPVTTDTDELLDRVARTRADHDAPAAPLIAVGDVVTYHLREAGTDPDVALLDGKTEREEVAVEIRRALADAGDSRLAVENPPGELSRELLVALREAIETPEATVIEVTGEEDLAAVPAILAAPLGSSVVYGQPGEGMVHVAVTPDTRDRAHELLAGFDGDVDGALAVIGVDSADHAGMNGDGE